MANAIRIISKRNGHRRAGIAHPDHPVNHPISRFSDEQLKQLRADPTLIIDLVTIEDDGEVDDGAPDAEATTAEGKASKAAGK